MLLSVTALLLAAMAGSSSCQVVFPTNDPDLPEVNAKATHECTASNGEGGVCYEFRSPEFKECSFFPSIDESNPDVASHLRSNTCRNTGREVYFCCPLNNSQQKNINSVLNTDLKTDELAPSTCAFPFIYRDVSYTTCTTIADPDGKLWCSTKTDKLNNHLKGNWKYCSLDEIPGVEEGLEVIPTEMDKGQVIIPTEAECGISLSNNVFGGEEADRGQFPWLAAIGQKIGAKFTPFCGGILITKQHVISAAHCFRKTVTRTFIRLGEHDINEDGDGAKDFKIADKRSHKNYNSYTKQDDIILLKLDRPLDNYTDAIRAACLPYHLRNNHFEGKNLTVVGWGTFKKNSDEIAPFPLKANVPVVPEQECQENYIKYRPRKPIRINSHQLCAGTGGIDSCKGDSGGPINYFDSTKGRIYVVGLVSFGPTPCGIPDVPGVYARIGYYLDWIQENIIEML